jgi:pimeloyl-ACP methyl ester carboxylesterase
MLEVIEKGSENNSRTAPLLFVHGAWHAAWCWDEHFLEFFAEGGFHALALSLRGHGNSATPKPLSVCSIADYVEDMRAVADALPTRPVVIGHWMSGLVVQKYLESHAAPAGVLLASIPPRGDGRALLRFTRRHPWLSLNGLATGDTTTGLNTPAIARKQLFSDNTPESEVTRTSPDSNRKASGHCTWMPPFSTDPGPSVW